MRIAVVCVGLLGLLVFALGIAVSTVRGQTQTLYGYTPDPADRLYKLVRAHGNAVEYAPILAVLILVLGWRGSGPWLQATFIAAVICRYLHAAGMITSTRLDRPNPLRFIGALVTYITGIILAVAVILTPA